MRQITKEMTTVFYNRGNKLKQNTEVKTFKDTNTTILYLHGNVIADIKGNELRIFDGGYRSNTTKERLNGLLSYTNYYVFQKNWEWYIGNDDNNIDTVPFSNGFTIKITL